MTKKFEDFLINVDGAKPEHGNKVLRFAEYRKGSSEYGQLFTDLMMVLRAKREEDKANDEIILNRSEFKDFDRLIILSRDIKKMRKLGMSFDVEVIDKDNIKFSNLGNKESRPWENLDSDPYSEEIWEDETKGGEIIRRVKSGEYNVEETNLGTPGYYQLYVNCGNDGNIVIVPNRQLYVHNDELDPEGKYYVPGWFIRDFRDSNDEDYGVISDEEVEILKSLCVTKNY